MMSAKTLLRHHNEITELTGITKFSVKKAHTHKEAKPSPLRTMEHTIKSGPPRTMGNMGMNSIQRMQIDEFAPRVLDRLMVSRLLWCATKAPIDVENDRINKVILLRGLWNITERPWDGKVSSNNSHGFDYDYAGKSLWRYINHFIELPLKLDISGDTVRVCICDEGAYPGCFAWIVNFTRFRVIKPSGPSDMSTNDFNAGAYSVKMEFGTAVEQCVEEYYAAIICPTEFGSYRPEYVIKVQGDLLSFCRCCLSLDVYYIAVDYLRESNRKIGYGKPMRGGMPGYGIHPVIPPEDPVFEYKESLDSDVYTTYTPPSSWYIAEGPRYIASASRYINSKFKMEPAVLYQSFHSKI